MALNDNLVVVSPSVPGLQPARCCLIGQNLLELDTNSDPGLAGRGKAQGLGGTAIANPPLAVVLPPQATWRTSGFAEFDP